MKEQADKRLVNFRPFEAHSTGDERDSFISFQTEKVVFLVSHMSSSKSTPESRPTKKLDRRNEPKARLTMKEQADKRLVNFRPFKAHSTGDERDSFISFQTEKVVFLVSHMSSSPKRSRPRREGLCHAKTSNRRFSPGFLAGEMNAKQERLYLTNHMTDCHVTQHAQLDSSRAITSFLNFRIWCSISKTDVHLWRRCLADSCFDEYLRQLMSSRPDLN